MGRETPARPAKDLDYLDYLVIGEVCSRDWIHSARGR